MQQKGGGSEHAEGGGVVGLVGDLVDEFAVDYLAVGVEDEDGTGEEPLQWTVDELNAVVACELRRAESRGGDYILQTFEGAETAGGKWKVGGDAEHHGIFLLGSLRVEAAHGGGADRCVEAWENVEHDLLAGKIGEVHLLELGCNKSEFGSLVAHCGEIAIGMACIAFEIYGFHI